MFRLGSNEVKLPMSALSTTVPRRTLALAATIFSLSSCGGGAEPAAPAPVTPVLTTLTLSASAAALKTGQTRLLVATTLDQNAQSMAAAVTWTSSSAATAAVSSSGLVTAGAAGTATITATATAGSRTVSGLATVTVTAPVVTSVTVTPATLALVQGGTGTLTAAVVADSGVATGVVWASSNVAAAVTSASGAITGAGAGTSQVCATSVFDASKQGCAAVTVTAAVTPVASVAITPTSVSLLVGQTSQLAATTRDANGVTLTGRAIAWSTSSASIATVSQTGLVSAVGAGAATISAVSEGKSGSAVATVSAPAASVTAVAVTPASSSITIGQTAQLSASVSGTNNPPTGVTWASADVTKVTVNQSGLASGIAVSSGTQVCATSVFDTSKSGCGSVIVAAATFPSSATFTTPGFSFSPSQVDIALAGTVTFQFAAVTHNVTFNATPGAPADVPNTSNASVSRQFNAAGTFNFQCTLHAGMTATVVVH